MGVVMKNRNKLKEKWLGLTDTVTRFPLTFLLLLTAVITNALALETQDNLIYMNLLITFLLGAAIFVVLQLLYERFLEYPVFRIMFMIITVAASIVYYLFIHEKDWSIEISIKTIVIFFLLFILFLWIPVIKSRYNMNESFMAVFKSFFTAIFFNGILYLGVVLVIGATNLLIVKVDSQAYIHAASIIFLFIAPTYFLTMLPVFPGKIELREAAEEKELQEIRQKLITPSRFLEALISYVMIPITVVFTIILLLYIIMNITGKFWTDNLMEPLLVSYSITVIVIYLLASAIHNPFTVYFRRIFPKILIPIVLFQTISSLLKISEVGITYGRYYVIMFGIFATIAGLLFCFVPIQRNGIIAPVLIVLTIISILPPLDAFTLSVKTQITRLERVLLQNNMLSNDTVAAGTNVSGEDQATIISAVNYLERMGKIKDIPYLSSYYATMDFDRIFGFSRYAGEGKAYQSYYYSRDYSDPIPIAGYDYMIQTNIHNQSQNSVLGSFTAGGESYQLLLKQTDENNIILVLADEQEQEIIRYEYNQLFSDVLRYNSNRDMRSTEEMTFTTENEKAVMTVIANSVSYNEWQEGSEKASELLLLINIK
jgi:hypothetical protein